LIIPIVSATPPAPVDAPTAAITVSIVSHGHSEWVGRLLTQLSEAPGQPISRVVLTHNLPAEPIETPPQGWPFQLLELFNAEPAGFGTNHNRAFRSCDTAYFCVLNPDIELHDSAIWTRLLDQLGRPKVGCAYPLLFNPDGSRQENERELVTPLALFRRHVLNRPQERADWVSAAFWVVPSAVWRSLGGFDECYFMYCEDVDFCVRLQLAGWKLARAEVSAGHTAGWQSRQLGPHLAWHLRSIVRLWAKADFRRYIARGLRGAPMSSIPNTRQ
jgi:N-acetylglucosaminyl-diphospho-decaprenol L-rhamnosyltransferase